CPECRTVLVKDEELVDYRCPNEECPAKIRGAIEYFVSRDGMNISGFGIKIVEKFIEAGLLRDITDIYLLKNSRETMVTMDKMGERSIDKLLENIEKSKSQEYSKVLYSLGIPSVGKTTAKILALATGSMERFSQMSSEELCMIEGIGEKSALEIQSFLQNPKNIGIIEKLKELGLNFQNMEKKSESSEFSQEFQGKSFLFTGKLNLLKRDEAQKIVEALGGINSGSVNKKLDYLVVGEDAGSKLEKAKTLGTVTVLTEEEFLQKTNKK
ncbi:MAG: helix-hairpin-helix domain-containing protein, partial [Fusobacteriaceae bacterium]